MIHPVIPRRAIYVALGVALILASRTFVAEAQPGSRMDWWREAKFGMFIHWGVYAVPAGT
jgi:alpha-L-fucosidase